MDYATFLVLHDKLKQGISDARSLTVSANQMGRTPSKQNRKFTPASLRGRKGNFTPRNGRSNYKRPPVPNGDISTSVRLACAIRYFAGGSPGDLMGQYCLSYASVMTSIWQVVSAINNQTEFHIKYPADKAEQKKIAKSFCDASVVKFDNCAGAIDGILIWMTKPTKIDSERSDLGPKRLYCGRKKKFGLNCQVVSDKRGRILDISMITGGATADCLALEASDLYRRLENGLLHDGMVLFGDNAYLNTKYMATPYTNVSAGSKDNYNYYHSQLRIRVECCFGILTQKWGILRTAMPPNMSIRRVVALVNALAKLHNFCIDQKDASSSNKESELMVNNPLDLQVGQTDIRNHAEGFVDFEVVDDGNSGGFTERTGVALQVPTDLMGGGHHFVEVPRDRTMEPPSLPRQQLHDVVLHSHRVRPCLRGTKVPTTKKKRSKTKK